MQAIYYPMSIVTVATGEKLVIHSFHDEYSLWFDVSKSETYVVLNLFCQLSIFSADLRNMS